MEHTKLISPSELEDFADRRDSEAVIPELIYWLVTQSCPDLTDCRIPYGDSIGLPGLDGLVKTDGGFRQYVPKQTSWWEIGTGKHARVKATGDYSKRLKKTPRIERAKATFVFATPRSRDWDQPSQERWIGAFVWRRYWMKQWVWVEQLLSLGWSDEQKLALLLLVPAEPDNWRHAEKILGIRGVDYWKMVQINPWGLDNPDDLLEAAKKLTSHGRPAAAIDCLYLLSHKKVPVPLSLASSVLLGVLNNDEEQRRIEQHHAIEVIKWLQEHAANDSDSEELFKIEWAYLPLLNRLHGGEPKILERRLASSPSFFCEVIAAVFRSDQEAKTQHREVTETERKIAQNAYSLLHGWQTLPGTSSDGSFDGNKFKEWLDTVKSLTKETGHSRIAMDQLGQAMAYAPADPSGLWIHRAIALALNSRDAAEMRRGFSAGLFNRRGVHGFSHGVEEMKIAQGYQDQAKALSGAGLHRVADEVRRLAESYVRDAQRDANRGVLDD